MSASTSASALPCRLRVFAFVIGILALANLACFTVSQTIIYDADGSGKGNVQLEMTVPRNTGDKSVSLSDAQDLSASIAEQGWENVTVTEQDAAHYLVKADYHFGPGEGDKPLSEVVPGFTLKAEEAENGYKYFTFEGKADFTEMESFWNTVQNDWAVNGITMSDDLFGTGSGDTKVTLSAAEVQKMIKTYGPPASTLRVILPGQTPVEANSFWDNAQDFTDGKTDTLVFSWKPGGRATAPLKAQRRLEPLTTVTAAEAQSQIEQLLAIYATAIPQGKYPIVQWWSGPLAGRINNNLTAFFNGGNYTCSDYQGRVMTWLDSIRTSPDESTHNLLKGLDYGPIETNGGGHRSVVLFQRGTDWRTTGLVLDPWPYQEPRAFQIGAWGIALWGFSSAANTPAPDSDAGNLYPHLSGKPSSYPASPLLQGDLSKGNAKPTRILFVRSPVTILVTFADGRRLGTLPDGTVVNDFGREASLYALPKDEDDSGVEWYLFLPEGNFDTQLTGTGPGEFHVLLATPNGYSGYGPQPIQSGQTATFSADVLGQASTLILPGGDLIQPINLSIEQIDTAMGIPVEVTDAAPTVVPTEIIITQGNSSGPASPSSVLPSTIDSQFLMTGGAICLGVIGVLAIITSLVTGTVWVIHQRNQPPTHAWLVIEGPEGAREQPLFNATLSLGRTPDNGLPLPNPNVSRRHASIDYEKGSYYLRDLGSVNGVLVNGRKINKPVKLAVGDVIRIEPYTIKFRGR